MTNCRKATRLLSAAQDRRLDIGERISLQMHLLICAGCRNYGEQLSFLHQACARRKAQGDESEPGAASPRQPR